jgi:AraC-like DNA-binding protein
MAKTGKKLTKSMVGEAGKIWKPLPPAKNSFEGACPEGVSAPRNVVMFSREQPAVLQRKAQASFQHRRFVLLFNAGTAGSVAVDGTWMRLRPGQALMIFPHQVHTYGHLEAKNLRWIFLTFEAEVPAAWESLRQRVVDGGEELWCLLDHAMKTWRLLRERSESLPYWAGLILQEMLRLVRGAKPVVTRSRGHWLPRVHARVHRPKDQVWRIKELARGLGVSEPHLRASFRAESGMSLGVYLRKVRMARAASLLAGTNRSVGEIALLCGYDSLYSFSRSFRASQASSPRAYRLRMKTVTS